MTPPVAEPDQVVSLGAPAWVTPLGVVGIVYASLGMLLGLAGVAMHFATPKILAWVADLTNELDEEAVAAMESSIHDSAPVMIVMTIVTLALGIVLIVGSVKLLHHRRSAGKWLRGWAFARIGLGVVGFGIVLYNMDESVRLAMQMAGDDASSEDMTRLQTIGGGVFGLVVTSIVPVALLIAMWVPSFRRAINSLPNE